MTETLFARVAPQDMPESARLAHDALKNLTGDATFVEVFARAPELLGFVMGDFYKALFFEGRLDRKYMELGRLRLSMNHGCRTCNSQNVPGVEALGYTGDQIEAMWSADYSAFPEDERAVMELADEIALNNRDGALTPSLYARLRRHFSDEQVLNLSLCLGVIVGLVKMSFALGLVEKEPYCEFGADQAA